MSRPTASLFPRRAFAPADGLASRTIYVFLTLVALLILSSGIACLVAHSRVAEPQSILAPAGLVMVILAAVQAQLLWHGWKSQALSVTSRGAVVWSRRMLLGSVLDYLACLTVGTQPWVGCAFLAGVAGWHTAMLLPLAAASPVVERWRRWSQGRGVRRLSWLVYATILLAIATEVGLRVQRHTMERYWLASRPAVARGDFDASLALYEDDFVTIDRRLASQRFRVAVVQSEYAAGTTRGAGYFARVEQGLLGVDFVPLSLAGELTLRSADAVTAQIAAAGVEMAMLVIDPCEAVTRTSATPSLFDWEQFELARRIATIATAPAGKPAVESGPPRDHQSDHFDLVSRQLAACRTPIDDDMRARWRLTLASLERLVVGCRAQQVAVVVVLVPSDFQVNRTMGTTLARRAGYTCEQLDFDLPQRKLTAFADGHGLPLVDLLPSFRMCRQSPFERDTTTWNDEGSAAAALALGGWLKSRYSNRLSAAAHLTSAP